MVSWAKFRNARVFDGGQGVRYRPACVMLRLDMHESPLPGNPVHSRQDAVYTRTRSTSNLQLSPVPQGRATAVKMASIRSQSVTLSEWKYQNTGTDFVSIIFGMGLRARRISQQPVEYARVVISPFLQTTWTLSKGFSNKTRISFFFQVLQMYT